MAGVTVVEDLDAENLLEHLCLAEEAKEVRGWVAEKTPRPAGLDKRLSSAAKLRGKGNVAYERKEWDAAVWLYLAALHHVDYSLKDSRADKLGDSVVGTAKLQEEVARVCANLAAAFSAKDDAYNAARSAALVAELDDFEEARRTFRATVTAVDRAGHTTSASQGIPAYLQLILEVTPSLSKMIL